MRGEEQIYSLLQPLDAKYLVLEEIAHIEEEAEVVHAG
jgi:hypothetical protein